MLISPPSSTPLTSSSSHEPGAELPTLLGRLKGFSLVILIRLAQTPRRRTLPWRPQPYALFRCGRPASRPTQ